MLEEDFGRVWDILLEAVLPPELEWPPELFEDAELALPFLPVSEDLWVEDELDALGSVAEAVEVVGHFGGVVCFAGLAGVALLFVVFEGVEVVDVGVGLAGVVVVVVVFAGVCNTGFAGVEVVVACNTGFAGVVVDVVVVVVGFAEVVVVVGCCFAVEVALSAGFVVAVAVCNTGFAGVEVEDELEVVVVVAAGLAGVVDDDVVAVCNTGFAGVDEDVDDEVAGVVVFVDVAGFVLVCNTGLAGVVVLTEAEAEAAEVVVVVDVGFVVLDADVVVEGFVSSTSFFAGIKTGFGADNNVGFGGTTPVVVADFNNGGFKGDGVDELEFGDGVLANLGSLGGIIGEALFDVGVIKTGLDGAVDWFVNPFLFKSVNGDGIFIPNVFPSSNSSGIEVIKSCGCNCEFIIAASFIALCVGESNNTVVCLVILPFLNLLGGVLSSGTTSSSVIGSSVTDCNVETALGVATLGVGVNAIDCLDTNIISSSSSSIN